MADDWIEDQRQRLAEKYRQCRSDGREPILEAFSVYLLRILNGLAQMRSDDICGYEVQILGEAMRLFCIHYAEQVEAALEPEISVAEKIEIIEDIEDAISKISNVYKNVIDSTSNFDRQMFTSQAVETSIYDISPKLFAAYSAILETLVRLFEKENIYAFLLHPSLKSNIETLSLFDMREREGKVVLIYIPENEIEKIEQVPIYLLHEAFHVLTKEERNRKNRAIHMELHIHDAIMQQIFRNVSFDFVESFVDGERADESIKKELMTQWFQIEDRIQELMQLDEYDRRLYSKNIQKQICANWRKWLQKIFRTLGEDLRKALDGKEYRKGNNLYNELIRSEWEIQRNLVEILAGNRVAQYAALYMSVYREAYADVACILTTGISPKEYEQAFRDCVIVSPGVLEKDIVQDLRIHIVARSIAACGNVNHAQEWKAYSETHAFGNQKSDGGSAVSNAGERGRESSIWILDDDLNLMERNLKKCSEKLWEKLGKKDSAFSKFRDILGQMNAVDILNGKVSENLQSLIK